MASFQQLLRQKDCIFGLFVNLNDPSVVEMAHLAGFDFIRIDLEHKMYDPATVLSLIRTADHLDMAVQVRISDVSEVTRLLDAGADGIVVPGATSVESVQEAIDAIKYTRWASAASAAMPAGWTTDSTGLFKSIRRPTTMWH